MAGPLLAPARPASDKVVKRTRRRPSELTTTDLATAAGCAASAVALTWLIFARLTEGVGWLGFGIVAYVTFVILFGLVTADRLGRLVATDRVATVLVSTGTILLMVPLGFLIVYIISKGIPHLRLNFFTEDQRGVSTEDPATEGGASHAIIGSLQQVALTLAFTVPLGLTTAVFLNETRSRFRRPIRILVDAMSGLPSVVAGLFVFAVFIIPYADSVKALGFNIFGYNGLMASLALSLVMTPTITRTFELVLRLVPDGLREASLALGASRARSVWSVVLPTARSGATTAIVLGIARAVGETAPLLFTSFGQTLMNPNPLNDPQESLPLFVYRYIREPRTNIRERGFVGATVLLLVVLALFAVARFIGRDRSRRTARRTQPLVARSEESPT